MSQAATYDAMFPAFKPTNRTVKANAKLEHTLKLIPQVVAETLGQTRELAPTLRGQGIAATCRNVWSFCKRNFRYRQDELGKEQVRSPRRSWHDRHLGIDCDCYSTLISSILTNLRIPHMLRVTKYTDPDDDSLAASQIPYSHIYVVAMDGGRAVKIDPVTDFFDFEQPYLAKNDIPMTLEYLNGLPNQAQGSIDRIDLGLGDLGLFKKKPKPAPNQRTNTTPTLAPPNPQKGKGANIINRFNPAAILLRTGILLGMKLNMFNIGSQLRFAYLTDAQAKSRNLNMARLAHLRKVHAKLEHAVFLGGGKPENLKKAILEGKGNHDKSVPLNGLGFASITPLGYGSDTPVSEILGPAIYQGEVTAYLNGLGSLGEPVTAAAAIAAATALLGSVAAVLKSVGDVKAGGAPGAAASGDEAGLTIPEYTDPGGGGQQALPPADAGAPDPGQGIVPMDEAVPTDSALPIVEPITSEGGSNQRTANSDPNAEPKKPGIVQWAKDNPVLAFGVIPAAALTLSYAIWKAVQAQKPKKAKNGPVNGLDGKPAPKKGKGSAKKGKGGARKGSAYKLML
jgi:hypothetical protein